MVDREGEGGAGGARVEVGGAVVRVERVERWVRWRKPVMEIGSFFVLVCIYPSFDNREGKMRKKFDRSFFCCRSGRRPAGELC